MIKPNWKQQALTYAKTFAVGLLVGYTVVSLASWTVRGFRALAGQ